MITKMQKFTKLSKRNLNLLDGRNYEQIYKGQLISKRFFGGSSISSKKRTKTHRILVKTNLFVRFLEEIDDPKNHF